MGLFYLAIDTDASLEEHVVWALDIWCPTHQTWEYADRSVWVHDVDWFLSKLIVALNNMRLVDSEAKHISEHRILSNPVPINDEQ